MNTAAHAALWLVVLIGIGTIAIAAAELLWIATRRVLALFDLWAGCWEHVVERMHRRRAARQAAGKGPPWWAR